MPTHTQKLMSLMNRVHKGVEHLNSSFEVPVGAGSGSALQLGVFERVLFVPQAVVGKTFQVPVRAGSGSELQVGVLGRASSVRALVVC
jgi:hypothetical protein